MASQYQARLDSLVAVIGNLLQSNALIAVTEKVRNGEPLDPFDIVIMDTKALFCSKLPITATSASKRA